MATIGPTSSKSIHIDLSARINKLNVDHSKDINIDKGGRAKSVASVIPKNVDHTGVHINIKV